MSDQFVNWDDLDLDDILGEKNWTDGEDEVIWGYESEWGSESDRDDNFDMPAASVPEKENAPTPTTKSSSKKSTNTYICPICKKQYKSPSGFRGHVLKKHDRPDLKAHKHIQDQVDTEEAALPLKRDVPISSQDDLEKEMPGIVSATLMEICNDQFHALPTSKFGPLMITIAQQLLAAQLLICSLMLKFCTPSSQLDEMKLRTNDNFVEGFVDIILSNLDIQLHLRIAKVFVQRYLTAFTNCYSRRQLELMDANTKKDFQSVTDNDKQVLFYICGFIIHTIRKRYLKSKNTKSLFTMLNLLSSDSKKCPESSWTDALDRGGLKRPSDKFFTIVVQVERWVRDIVDVRNLQADTLINLKERLIHYRLLRVSWEQIITDDNADKWLVLDHILGLFFKVRGFAITRLVRKQILQKRKASKIAAGSRKALRKELRDIANNVHE